MAQNEIYKKNWKNTEKNKTLENKTLKKHMRKSEMLELKEREDMPEIRI